MTKCLDKTNDTVVALKHFGFTTLDDDELLLRIFTAENTTENGTYIQPAWLTLEGKQVLELYNFLNQYFGVRDPQAEVDAGKPE